MYEKVEFLVHCGFVRQGLIIREHILYLAGMPSVTKRPIIIARTLLFLVKNVALLSRIVTFYIVAQ